MNPINHPSAPDTTVWSELELHTTGTKKRPAFGSGGSGIVPIISIKPEHRRAVLTLVCCAFLEKGLKRDNPCFIN